MILVPMYSLKCDAASCTERIDLVVERECWEGGSGFRARDIIKPAWRDIREAGWVATGVHEFCSSECQRKYAAALRKKRARRGRRGRKGFRSK